MTKVKSNCWGKSRGTVKTFYFNDNNDEYITVIPLMSSARYNFKTKVFSLRYIGNYPTLIAEQETRKTVLKELKKFLNPTSGCICVVEQMKKSRNEDNFKYGIQYYTTLSDIPTNFEMKEIEKDILQHPVESDDDEYALWLKCNREITRKCTGLDYDENHITKAGISEIYHKKYAPSITLEEYIASEA